MIYKAIVAMTRDGIIGNNGKIPWHYPEDLKYFREVTLYHPVVMGRKTYEGICSNYGEEFIRNGGPLNSSDTGRRQIVLTRDEDYDSGADYGVKVVHSYDECKRVLDRYTETRPEWGTNFQEPFIIGGSEIYDLFWSDLDQMYITFINEEYNGDTRFPKEIRLGEEWHIRHNPWEILPLSRDELSYMFFERK